MFGLPGGMEYVVIGLIALLLFGNRLPGVARSLGQAFHEFKAGLAGKESPNSDAASEEKTDSSKKEGEDKTDPIQKTDGEK